MSFLISVGTPIKKGQQVLGTHRCNPTSYRGDYLKSQTHAKIDITKAKGNALAGHYAKINQS